VARPRKQPQSEAYQRLAGVDPPQRVVQDSMRRLERRLEREFKEAERSRRESARAIQPAQAALREAVEQRGGGEAAKRVAALHARRRRAKLARVQDVVKVPPVVFGGPIGAVRVPPYTWAWTWSARSGSPDAPEVDADANAGTMGVTLETGLGGGSAAGAAALGIFFHPPYPGQLWFTAAPAYSWGWAVACSGSSASADMFIGMYLAAYTPAWVQYAVPVDQRNYLWNSSHWGWTNHGGKGDTSGYSLSAGTYVDSGSYYALWVWCGGSASGDGDHVLWGSYGLSWIDVMLPWMSWSLF